MSASTVQALCPSEPTPAGLESAASGNRTDPSIPSRSAAPTCASAEPVQPTRRPEQPVPEPTEPRAVPDPESPASRFEPGLPGSQPAPEPTRKPARQSTPYRLEPESGSAWESAPVPDGYTLDSSGVADSKSRARIAGSPIWLKGTTVERTSGDHGLIIAWRDAFGVQHELAITRNELHAHGSPLSARLARAGVLVVHGHESKLLKYLSEFDVKELPRWQAVPRVGWIETGDDELAYMLPPPQGLLAHDSHLPVIFQPERESPSTISVFAQGTLEDWNNRVVSLCKNNPLLLFPILVGLSGPLLRFAELESGGFHYYGRSSHGKTTAAQAAASVWGNGADPAEAPDRAFVQKWNSTANAFEALLCAHNDALLVLDEIHTCDAKDFGAVIYNMASGRGKQALDRERQLRPARKWRTVYFSTGEVSVLSKLEADGKPAHAGQLVRLIDIPIEGGIITETGSASPAEHADRLKAACSRYFGSAGPAFIRALQAHYETVGQLVGTIKTKVEDHVKDLAPKDAPPEVHRAVKRFALAMTAGEMGIKLGVLDCEMIHVATAVRTALRAWLTDSARLPDRLRGVMNVAAFIHRHATRFQGLSEPAAGHIPRDRAGYRGYDRAADGEVYMFTGEGFREACGGLDPRETAEELKRRRFLVSKERGRHQEKREVGGERGRFYIVKAAILEFDPLSAPADKD